MTMPAQPFDPQAYALPNKQQEIQRLLSFRHCKDLNDAEQRLLSNMMNCLVKKLENQWVIPTY